MYHGKNLLSVNLEDYFQVSPMRQIIPPRYWPRFSLRVEETTRRTLDLLDRYDHKATFFVLGWLAERCPDLMREIVRRGHDVASKGYLHRDYGQLSPEEFRADLLRSIDAIEQATGTKVRGYRIAAGSLPIDDKRPFEILARAGIRYDASVRPFGLKFVRHGDWRKIRDVAGEGWSIKEVPLSSDTLLGIPVPMTGGNYLRQSPTELYSRRLRSHLARAQAPWHFYFHAWELDPDQPRVSATNRVGRVRQYRNLELMRERIEGVLASTSFTSIADNLGLAPEPAPAKLAVAARAARPIVVDTSAAMPVSIVVPCYNEEATLPYLKGILDSVAAENAGSLKLTNIFVDDGSADRTWEKLNELFGDREDCILIKHPKNRGIAAATMTGIRAAKDEIVCGIDCDCSFDPHELAKMIPLLKPGIDLVQASPYHPRGGVLNVPAWRLALSRNLSRIYNRILNHQFASYTACFRVYRRSKVADLELTNGGFMGIMELFILLDQGGSKIIEFPAVLETRLLGVSKMKTLSVIKNHLGMIRELVFQPTSVAKRASPRDASPTGNPS